MKSFIVYVAAIMFLASGSVYGWQEANKSSSAKTISGNIFVVTNGQNAIKLALVNVVAISENELTKHMRNKYRTGYEEKKAILDTKLKVTENVKEIYAQLAMEKEKVYNSNYSNNLKILMIERIELARQEVDIKLEPGIKEVNNRADYYTKGQFYFEDMPTPISTAKTDADGKFTFTLPAGKYALAAKSSRQVVGKEEFYHWLIWVDTSVTNNSLMLSNDNLFETGCNECVQPEKFSE